MSKRLFIFAAVFSLCMSAGTRAETFRADEFTLDNGLRVVVIENHKAPVVQQMLFYKVGAMDEPAGRGGVAHLLEHLMFRGTELVKGQKFNRILEENGADSNAFTSQDVTAYHQFMDISRLELAMFLEADRMQGLKIAEDDFAAERAIVFQERKQRVDNNPSALFMEKVKRALWQEHPYANPVTGQDKEIMSLKRADALDFYHAYYAPNNAVLVLSGDITPAEAKSLAVKYYGKLRSVKTPTATFTPLPETYKAKVAVSLPEVRLGRFVKIFAAPSLTYRKDEVYALDVLSEYLAGDENAPLYQKMVLRDKTALGVDISYDAAARSYGAFVLSAVPAGKPDDEFAREIAKNWQRAVNALTEDKLNNVKRKMLADLVYLKDNPATLAQLAGYMVAVGGNLTDLQNYAANIRKVSVTDVKNAAADLWNGAPQVEGCLYPEGEQL